MFTKDQIEGKRVLVRADLDVDVENNLVTENFRLKKLLPVLNFCLQHASQVCLIGHRGRPNGYDYNLSLDPVAKEIKRLTNQQITLVNSGFSPGEWWKGGQKLLLLDNLRFDKREESLSNDFARELSAGADLYIYEAFATYRPCTSLNLLPKYLPTFTGFQFDLEVKTLSEALDLGAKPNLLIASGAKADKKVLLDKISHNFNYSFFGGIFAQKSDLLADGLDINENATKKLDSLIDSCQTIVVNGPLGKYEDGFHDKSTAHLFQRLADLSSTKKTILGGGDTITALKKLGFSDTQYGFISTGGGGMLDFILNKVHPLTTVLK